MPRKNKDDEFILSAGEISTYILCPENWRLNQIENIKPKQSRESKEGTVEHQSWTKELNDAIYYTWASRIIILLMFLIVIVYIFTRGLAR